jgi:choline-phosphate cytidylyltransferase
MSTDIFLSKPEKERLRKWQYSVEDKSITTVLFNPFWNWLVKFVPNSVAPNILSLAGLISVLYAYHISHNYLNYYPKLVSITSVLLVFLYMNLDAIDGKHARNIKNSSPLGELFDHSCDNIGLVFMILIFCNITGIDDSYLQWYIVQTAQLVFLYSHIRAFRDKIVKFGRFTGPGECLVAYMGYMVFHAFGIMNLLYVSFDFIAYYLCGGRTKEQCATIILPCLYYIVFGIVFLKIMKLKDHYSTRNGLLISLLSQLIPSMLLYVGIGSNEVDTYTVISHGLIMAVLTGDIIVSKMAGRELHALVPILMILSLFDNFLCITGCIIYYVGIFTELSFSMRIPLFNVTRNVYCNGVFDMCHAGHMNLFEQAAKNGTRLIVGVHNDEDVESYKRTPVMKAAERYAVVAKCKFVDEIVQNAPLSVYQDFIDEHNIHVVMCSEEYDKPDDEYYRVPRELGILKVLPRTDGISTTDLMTRVKERDDSKIEK